MAQPSTPRRSNEGFLQPLERPALQWLVRRLPKCATPDRLTALGFVGACMAAGGYLLVRCSPDFLWLSIAGLAVNWFGDSLDGTLARHRGIERPRYGFFLDQNLDAFAQWMFAICFGLSGLIRLDVALLTLSTYFLMTIFTLVRSITVNVFAITMGGIGLTEIRIGFALLNVAMYFYPPVPVDIAGVPLSYPEALAFIWIVLMLVSFVIVMTSGVRRLAAEEGPGRSQG